MVQHVNTKLINILAARVVFQQIKHSQVITYQPTSVQSGIYACSAQVINLLTEVYTF